MNNVDTIKPMRRLLVGHGALVIFLGCVLGWGFLFFLMGEISLWPIPGKIDYQLPGTYDAWRMAHMEGIVNGALLWIAAAILPLIPLSTVAVKRLTYLMLAVAWSISIASALDPIFPESRGLMAGGSLTNNLAFGLFYIGVPGSMIVMIVIAWKALRTPPDDEVSTGEAK